MRTFAPYLSAAMAATASFAASGIAGFVSLYFLAQTLSKEEFGAYSLAANVMLLVALLATLGLDRTLLLRLAPLDAQSGNLLGRSLFWQTCWIGAGFAAVLGLAVWLAAGKAGDGLISASATWWIMALVPALVPLTLLALARAWFQANHRAGDAALMPGVADAARAGMIAMAFAASLGKTGVAVAFCLSALVPLIILGFRARGHSESLPAGLPARQLGRDIGRGLIFCSQRVVDVGLYLIDIIIIGLVASDAVIAEYAIAARLAAMTDLGRLALISAFTPRVRMHHHAGNATLLAQEYHRARLASFVIACLVAVAMTLTGSRLLAFFGDFSSSYDPLMVLVSGYVFTAASGLHASYLTMTGEVRLSALIRAFGLALAIAALALLTPQFGAMGAAIAITFVMCAINIASMLLLWRKTGFRAFGVVPMGAGICAMLVLFLCATGHLSAPLASGGLIAVLIGFTVIEWLRPILVQPSAKQT